jgi:hypothetical protein
LSASSLVRENAIKAASSAGSNKKQKTSNNNSNSNRNSRNNNKTSLFKNIADSQAVISEYHTLNKRLEQNENDTSITTEQRKRNADNIRKQQEEMGGLDRYQKASIFGAKSSKFVCADWVVPFLLLGDGTKKPKKQKQNTTGQQKLEEDEEEEEKKLCDKNKTRQQQQQQQQRNIRILDVGAIDNQYKKYDNWLDAVPIDLHGGQHESVIQVDFFDYAHEYCLKNDLAAAESSTATNNDEYDNKGKRRRHKSSPSSSSSSSSSLPPPQPFDAIVMSLVLNFQGDPRKRGDMIALAADPRLLRSDTKGMLFVALPSASLDNSRYCDLNRFVDVCKKLGFVLVEKKKSLKLVLLAFRRRASDSNDDDDDVDDDDNDDDNNFDAKRRQTHHHYYNAKTRTFDYGKQEMKRLPAKPGAKRNNFSVILKSTVNRDK